MNGFSIGMDALQTRVFEDLSSKRNKGKAKIGADCLEKGRDGGIECLSLDDEITRTAFCPRADSQVHRSLMP